MLVLAYKHIQLDLQLLKYDNFCLFNTKSIIAARVADLPLPGFGPVNKN